MSSMSTTAFVGVGSNLGNRKQIIRQAEQKLSHVEDIRFIRSAPIYETQPVSGPKQDLFLNTVWEIETDLSAHQLLVALFQIESDFGRLRL